MSDAPPPAGDALLTRAANKLQNLRATVEPAKDSSSSSITVLRDLEQPRYQPPQVETASPVQPKKKSNKGKGKQIPSPAISAGPADEAPPSWVAHLLTGISSQIQAGVSAAISEAKEQSRSRSRGRSFTPRNTSRVPSQILNNRDEPRITTETTPPTLPSRGHINHWKPRWPATLDDGKTILYWPWKMKCENIFRNHPADFPLLEDKLELLLESTAGKAQRALQARMIPGSLNPILELQDAWDCLKQVTVDSTEMTKADHAFRELTMLDSDTFTDFIAEFQDLSAKAQLVDPVKARKDLWNKLCGRLQKSLMSIEADLVTFEQLMNRAAHVDVQSSYSNIRTSRGSHVLSKPKITVKREVNTGSGYVPATGALSGRAGTPFDKAATPKIRFQTPDKNDHSTKTCYNCGRLGHISPDCTVPKTSVNKIDLEAELNQLEEMGNDETGKEDS